MVEKPRASHWWAIGAWLGVRFYRRQFDRLQRSISRSRAMTRPAQARRARYEAPGTSNQKTARVHCESRNAERVAEARPSTLPIHQFAVRSCEIQFAVRTPTL